MDAAVVAVVRLAREEAWTACGAARSVRERVPDSIVLGRALARVQRALIDGPSRIAQRAALTLQLAIDGDHTGEAGCASCVDCEILVDGDVGVVL